MEASEAKPVTAPRILLGLFIVGQLVFLFTTNFLGFVQEYKDQIPKHWQAPIERIAPGFTKQEGHVWELTQTLSRLTEMWEHGTGQAQQWMLFAPRIGKDCTFPAVELTDSQAMPQAPELWLSDNEPEDIERFFRFGNFRLRRFENNLVVDLSADDSEAKEEIDRYLKKDGDLVFAYLQWRLEQIQQRKTTRQQPHQVILLMRRYRINDPGEGEQLWEGPHTTPVARWQPGIAENPNFLPLEMYNPVTKQFESVPK